MKTIAKLIFLFFVINDQSNAEDTSDSASIASSKVQSSSQVQQTTTKTLELQTSTSKENINEANYWLKINETTTVVYNANIASSQNNSMNTTASQMNNSSTTLLNEDGNVSEPGTLDGDNETTVTLSVHVKSVTMNPSFSALQEATHSTSIRKDTIDFKSSSPQTSYNATIVNENVGETLNISENSKPIEEATSVYTGNPLEQISSGKSGDVNTVDQAAESAEMAATESLFGGVERSNDGETVADVNWVNDVESSGDEFSTNSSRNFDDLNVDTSEGAFSQRFDPHEMNQIIEALEKTSEDGRLNPTVGYPSSANIQLMPVMAVYQENLANLANNINETLSKIQSNNSIAQDSSPKNANHHTAAMSYRNTTASPVNKNANENSTVERKDAQIINLQGDAEKAIGPLAEMFKRFQDQYDKSKTNQENVLIRWGVPLIIGTLAGFVLTSLCFFFKNNKRPVAPMPSRGVP